MSIWEKDRALTQWSKALSIWLVVSAAQWTLELNCTIQRLCNLSQGYKLLQKSALKNISYCFHEVLSKKLAPKEINSRSYIALIQPGVIWGWIMRFQYSVDSLIRMQLQHLLCTSAMAQDTYSKICTFICYLSILLVDASFTAIVKWKITQVLWGLGICPKI